MSPQTLVELQSEVDQVLLAIPSLLRRDRLRIVNSIQKLDISVFQVPSLFEITSGLARIDSLRPINVEDLLGREPLSVDTHLLGANFLDSVVCVTGAGGSIGSELCRQILRYRPSKIILLEISEISLYSIDQELRPLLPDSIQLYSVLGSTQDYELLFRLFREHKVDFIFHAAAYKHVPLVENNPLQALLNNVFSTKQICRAAIDASVQCVVVVSTDKAVRPTNVMGASKRLSELVVQAYASLSQSTRLSLVRFGNVLGSSGSVVPLFRRQILNGGPVTLTHPEIIRYFMTIGEAASLVLHTALLSDGGDVFLLDMGEPVRIKHLAEQMIRLSGLTIKDQRNPSGDIEIVCTGLRPGEKLYEELLIDAKSLPTLHPLIFRAQESFLPYSELIPKLNALESSLATHDIDLSLSILSKLVPEWKKSKFV